MRQSGQGSPLLPQRSRAAAPTPGYSAGAGVHSHAFQKTPRASGLRVTPSTRSLTAVRVG